MVFNNLLGIIFKPMQIFEKDKVLGFILIIIVWINLNFEFLVFPYSTVIQYIFILLMVVGFLQTLNI